MRGEEKNENKKGRWNGGGEMKWTLSFGKLRGKKKEDTLLKTEEIEIKW